MNLLAHAHLGRDLDGFPNVVNIIWDFIGKQYRVPLTEPIETGKRRHLLIDRLADRSDYFRANRQIISTERRKVSGILIDLYSDYFLAKNWKRFNDRPLEEYIDGVRSLILKHAHELNEASVHMCKRITNQNWFADYLTIEGIGHVLNRIAFRSSPRVRSLLMGAEEELRQKEARFETGFVEFYRNLDQELSGDHSF